MSDFMDEEKPEQLEKIQKMFDTVQSSVNLHKHAKQKDDESTQQKMVFSLESTIKKLKTTIKELEAATKELENIVKELEQIL